MTETVSKILTFEALQHYHSNLQGYLTSHFKPLQTAVVDPTASGSATSFIDTISQDANGKITVTKKSIGTLSGYIKYDDVLMPTNPFGGKKLYINGMDNAFASANLRYWVRVTTHKQEINGVTYPYVDTTKTITDADYFVDSPIVSTLTTKANLFDGNYETTCSCPANHYMKIHIQFAPFTDAWTPGSGTAWTGYPYGSYFLSYYYTNTPSRASQVRVYNKYAAHTVGWHLYTMTAYAGSTTQSGYIERLSDESDYQRSCVEFIVYGKTTGTAATNCTQVDYKLSRPNLSNNGATVTKFGAQSLYHTFSWYTHDDNGASDTTTSIGPSGVSAPSAIGAVAVANGDRIIIADSSNSNKMTPAVLFDGATTSKILSKKGKWVTPAVNVGTQSVKLKFTGTSAQITASTTATTTESTSPTISGTITTGISSGGTISSTYTPSGSITNGAITIAAGSNATNLLTSSVAPTATQVLTSVAIPTNAVVVSGTTKYFHPTATSGAVGAVVEQAQAVLTGKTTKYMSATSSGVSATSDTAVSAYTSNTPSTATWTKTYTQITGTTDDYELTFNLSESTVLASMTFGTSNVAASTHTHGAPTITLVENDTSATGRLEYVKTAASGTAASSAHTHAFTQPTISLGSNTTATDGIQYIEAVTSGNPALTTNSAWTDTFASEPTLSRETALKTLGTISQGTSTFAGTEVTLASTHNLSAAHSHNIPALTVTGSTTAAGTITNDGTTETFSTGASGAATITYTEES